MIYILNLTIHKKNGESSYYEDEKYDNREVAETKKSSMVTTVREIIRDGSRGYVQFTRGNEVKIINIEADEIKSITFDIIERKS